VEQQSLKGKIAIVTGGSSGIAQATPLKKIVQPDDVARAILACVTHLKVTTGAVIVCDGGRFLN